MTLEELERRISELQARPPVLLCRTQKGKVQVMTTRECMDTGSIFIHVVRDDLDALLAYELAGGDDDV